VVVEGDFVEDLKDDRQGGQGLVGRVVVLMQLQLEDMARNQLAEHGPLEAL
jgi:hypothetical protein